MACTIAWSRSLPLKMSSGMSRQRGVDLMCRQVSSPDIPGSCRSSRMQSTACTSSSSSASSPDGTSTTS
jgi:hypothetical protein